MAHTNTLCPTCRDGLLKCHNTSKINDNLKHPLEQARVSSWQCNNPLCDKYYKLYTPSSELICVNKRPKTTSGTKCST